jgi:hypothetical protein
MAPLLGVETLGLARLHTVVCNARLSVGVHLHGRSKGGVGWLTD